jgi:hypothetical protein
MLLPLSETFVEIPGGHNDLKCGRNHLFSTPSDLLPVALKSRAPIDLNSSVFSLKNVFLGESG